MVSSYTYGAGAVGICQLIRVQKKNRSHTLEKLLSEGTDFPALHSHVVDQNLFSPRTIIGLESDIVGLQLVR